MIPQTNINAVEFVVRRWKKYLRNTISSSGSFRLTALSPTSLYYLHTPEWHQSTLSDKSHIVSFLLRRYMNHHQNGSICKGHHRHCHQQHHRHHHCYCHLLHQHHNVAIIIIIPHLDLALSCSSIKAFASVSRISDPGPPSWSVHLNNQDDFVISYFYIFVILNNLFCHEQFLRVIVKCMPFTAVEVIIDHSSKI